MSLYSRPQLTLLLVLIATAGTGLAVGHWRRAHPELAEHLEQLDRAPAEPAAIAPGGAGPRTAPKRRLADGEHLDLNVASAEELARLPGVGAGLARRIVDARERDGPFATVDDLGRVRGLSRARVDRLRPLLDVTP